LEFLFTRDAGRERRINSKEVEKSPLFSKEIMAKKLYVGNLSYSTSNESLSEAFAAFGKVESATVIMDKMSGRSKGFGFVEMSSDEEAQAAISSMDGKNLDGRNIRVSEARPPENNGDRRSSFRDNRY
jgi:RNA recognition motif-containing protein